MKHLIIAIYSFVALSSFGQEVESSYVSSDSSSSFKNGWVSNNLSYNDQIGLYSFQNTSLNNFLVSKTGSDFGDYIFSLGFSFITSRQSWINKEFRFDSHFDLYAFTSFISLYSNSPEGIRYYTGGINFGFDNCKDLAPNHELLDILVGLGFNTGTIVFRTFEEDIRNKYYKLYFAPKIVGDVRFFLFNKKLSVSVRPEIQFDITNSKWFSFNKNIESIGTYKATGYGLTLAIGPTE